MNLDMMKPKKPMTPPQQLVFDYICDCLDKEGIPPSFVEIQNKMGYRSVNSVTTVLRALQVKGWVRLIAGKSRGIIPTTATIESGKCKDVQMTV